PAEARGDAPGAPGMPPAPRLPAGRTRRCSRRAAATGLAVGPIGIALAACGSLQPAQSKPEASAATLELISYTWGQRIVDLWNTALPRSQARHPQIKIQPTYIPDGLEAMTKLDTLAVAGSEPDVAMTSQTPLLPWAVRKWLVDLTSYIQREKTIRSDEWYKA